MLECAIDVWGRSGPAPLVAPLTPPEPEIDEDAIAAAAAALGAAKRPFIICGGGAQGASAEVTALAHMLQAPVLGYRRGRGVLDSRDPLSVTLPLGRDLWAEADVVLARRHAHVLPVHASGASTTTSRSSASIPIPRSRRGSTSPQVALVGDAQPILRRLVDAVATRNIRRPSRAEEMRERHARWDEKLAKLAPQRGFLDAIRAELPEDGIFVDEVTQMGFVARLAFPVYKPRTFLSPGYQDNLGWGFATALGAQNARRDVPVVAISGDGGFMFTANELSTAVRHRIPLVAVVFADGAFGNVRRIQEERYGNRLIASDLANPDFIRFAESFGAAAERAARSRRAARRAAPRLCPPRRPDADRGAGRPDAVAVGVHPHAEGAGRVSGRSCLSSDRTVIARLDRAIQ